MAFADPRSCLGDFLQFGRNLGKRPPSLSLRNLQRDIRAASTQVENIGTRIEGAIGAAARGEFLPGQLLSVTNEFRCPPTHYANYFSQHRQPKFKFMFFVSMEIHPDFKLAFGSQSAGWPDGEMWWFIKQAGRPNISYEYEDVNMYNFRQKILRRATLEPIQLQIFDDLQDASHGFWNTFLRIQNPVTNLNVDALIEENGMNWHDPRRTTRDEVVLPQIRSNNGEVGGGILALLNSSSTGVLPGGLQAKQIIKEIRVHHLIDWGQKIVVYRYVNPRINEIRMDELSWESNDPSMIDVTFEYDTFQILFPVGTTEDEVNKHTPPIFPINVQSDETPSSLINKGIDKFNKGVGAAADTAKEIAGGITGSVGFF